MAGNPKFFEIGLYDCTDPRTMMKHKAYSEWADAYSCTRHRCQPGGRNLAIYTVGCKRVEAPESAIECEEVVEDTNMQFPFCCTRLRCLVVVRGEVWTRVLGQPWETLPAAPWSHMYKMKKPPPGDTTFLPKSPDEGPVYELQTDAENGVDKEKSALRSGRSQGQKQAEDCDHDRDRDVIKPRAMAAPSPDIVIALATGNEGKDHALKMMKNSGRIRRGRKNVGRTDDNTPEPEDVDVSEPSERPPEPGSEEKYSNNYYNNANSYGATQKPIKPQMSWTEIPQNQWNEHEPSMDVEVSSKQERLNNPADQPSVAESEKKEEKPGNLQALVDAIGSRMRDIETVVHRMSEKVHQVKTAREPSIVEVNSGEQRRMNEKVRQTKAAIEPSIVEVNSGEQRRSGSNDEVPKHASSKEETSPRKPKRPLPESEQHYRRFSRRGSKYLRGSTEAVTTEPPLFIEENNLNGYYSDSSNSLVRRAPKNPPQQQAREPSMTYMAPVETRRKAQTRPEPSDSGEKRRKKHNHKKKRSKGHHKRHHGKEDKRKHFNKITSNEVERNVVSLEDSSALQTK